MNGQTGVSVVLKNIFAEYPSHSLFLFIQLLTDPLLSLAYCHGLKAGREGLL